MNFFTIILSTLIFLMGFFFLQLNLYFKGNMLLNRLLGLIFLSRALLNFWVLLLTNGHLAHYPTLFIMAPLLNFLCAATAFLYVRSFIEDATKLKKWDWLNLLPILFVLLNMYPFLTAPKPMQEHFMNEFLSGVKSSQINAGYSLTSHYIFRSVIFFVYLSLCWRLFFKALKNKTAPLNRVHKNWLAIFLAILSISHVFWLATAVYYATNEGSMASILQNNWFIFIVSLQMGLFSIILMKNPIIFYGHLVAVTPVGIAEMEQMPETAQTEIHEKPVKSDTLLSPEQIEMYAAHFDHYMVAYQPYLDPKLPLNAFAEKLQLSEHHCSYFINHVLKMTFRDYINQHRIRYFIEQYHLAANSHLSLEAIALSAGFEQRSTFFRVFKKEMGCTPQAHLGLSNLKNKTD